MASVGSSVRKAIDDWSVGDLEFAMLHACNAVDGTANRAYPTTSGSNERFTRCLRDNYDVLGPMGMPGIDLANTRWPVKVERPKATGGLPDLADVIYGIHRCSHGHGAELPDGFELIPNASGPPGYTEVQVQRGRIRLSDRIIFGLLGVAVFSPANVGQVLPDGYVLKYGAHIMPINQWWGRIVDARAVMASVPLPNVKIDFSNWTGGP